MLRELELRCIDDNMYIHSTSMVGIEILGKIGAVDGLFSLFSFQLSVISLRLIPWLIRSPGDPLLSLVSTTVCTF